MDQEIQHLKTFVKWFIYALIIGTSIGSVASLFSHTLSFVAKSFNTNPYLLYGLPFVGLVIVFLYHLAGVKKSQGTNLVFKAVHQQKAISILMAPLIFISTALTHLCGGSAGREGAALQLGGSIGQNIARRLKLDLNDQNIFVICGMSSAFAALFGTPITATIFAIEVVSIGIMHYAALVPCALSSLIACQVAQFFSCHAEHINLQQIPPFSINMAISISILAILLAYLSILFCLVMHTSHHLFEKFFPNAYIRIFMGGTLIVVLTLLVGRNYNGAGMPYIIEGIETGKILPYAFLFKLLFTAITLGSGFKGGEIVPCFYVGGAFGLLIGPYLGIPASFAGAIGLVVLFCGVTNSPMTSLFLALELFGVSNLTYFFIALAICYMLSGYHGLYGEQKIMYSKYSTTFINHYANQSLDL